MIRMNEVAQKLAQEKSRAMEERRVKELEKHKKLSRKMARLLMRLGDGDDVHDEAYAIVEKHFPDIWKEFQ